MFIHLSIHHPKRGHEQHLIDSMHRYGEAAKGAPGLREVHTLKDLRSQRLVGLAIWKDETSWREGVEAMRSAVEDDPFEEWEEREPQGFALVDI